MLSAVINQGARSLLDCWRESESRKRLSQCFLKFRKFSSRSWSVIRCVTDAIRLSELEFQIREQKSRTVGKSQYLYAERWQANVLCLQATGPAEWESGHKGTLLESGDAAKDEEAFDGRRSCWSAKSVKAQKGIREKKPNRRQSADGGHGGEPVWPPC